MHTGLFLHYLHSNVNLSLKCMSVSSISPSLRKSVCTDMIPSQVTHLFKKFIMCLFHNGKESCQLKLTAPYLSLLLLMLCNPNDWSTQQRSALGIRTSHSQSRTDNPSLRYFCIQQVRTLHNPVITRWNQSPAASGEDYLQQQTTVSQAPVLYCQRSARRYLLFFLMRHLSVRLSFKWAKCRQSSPLYSCYGVQPWASGNCAPIPLPAEISFMNSASSLPFFLPQLPAAICHG